MSAIAEVAIVFSLTLLRRLQRSGDWLISFLSVLERRPRGRDFTTSRPLKRFVAQEHFANYRLCIRGGYDDGALVMFHVGYARKCVQDFAGETGLTADGASSTVAFDLCRSALTDDAAFVDDDDA